MLRRRLDFLKAKTFERLSIFNDSIIIYRETQQVKKKLSYRDEKYYKKMGMIRNFIQKVLF